MTVRGARVRFLLVFSLFTFSACGGGGGGGGGGGTLLATVSGTILDSANQPVAGATVTIASDPVSTVTDSGGWFSLDVEVGPHSLTAVKDGYTLYFDGSLEVSSGSSPLSSLTPTSPFYATPVTWYADSDGDGYGNPASPSGPSSYPSGNDVYDSADCDDASGGTHPGALEACDGADNDCDAATDEGDPGGGSGCLTGQPGVCSAGITVCTGGEILCARLEDPSTEICDDADNDCDGLTDDEDPGVEGRPVWYRDADQDSWTTGETQAACVKPAYFSDLYSLAGTEALDCADTDAAVFPGAAEVCDGADNDCDAMSDEGNPGGGGECQTGQPGVCAAGIETCSGGLVQCFQVAFATTEVCGGYDDDCDGLTDNEDPSLSAPVWYADADADSFGDPGSPGAACAQPQGHVGDNTDCDDSDPSVNPSAAEVCDSTDNDCDDLVDDADPSLSAQPWYADGDADLFGDPASSTPACAQPLGYVADSTDCDDANSLLNPATVWYADVDEDGYSDMVPAGPVCERPAGHVLAVELVSTVVEDMDDSFATTGVTGRALLSLYDAIPAEVVLFDLSDGSVYDASGTPHIPWPADAVGVPSGQGAFLLSYSDRKILELDLSQDTVIPAPNGELDSNTADFGYMMPITGAFAGGWLAAISYEQDLLLWDSAAGESSYLDVVSGSLWDVTGTSAGTAPLFAVADYAGNRLLIVSDSAAVVDSIIYSDPARAIPSTSNGPLAVAFSPDGTRLYAANYASADLLVFAFDAASGAASFLASVELRDTDDGTWAVLYNSNGMVVSPDGGTVWIAADYSNGVVAYDTASGSVDHVPLNALGSNPQPGQVSMTFDGRFVLVPGSALFNEGDNRLYIVDATTHVPALTIDTVNLTTGDPLASTRPVAVVPY